MDIGSLRSSATLARRRSAWLEGAAFGVGLDVVHARAGLGGFAAGDIGDRRRAEDLAEGANALGPDTARLARLLADLAVQDLHDLEHGDLGRGLREGVAALDAALAREETATPERREELLEELDRHVPPLGDLRDRDRAGAAGAGELGHRDDRVAGL